jgi:hypothetical protein
VRLLRAECLRCQRRNRGHDAHADNESAEQYRMRQRGCGHHAIAKPPQQRQIGRHHCDLTKLRQRHRQGEPDRVAEFSAPNRWCCRRCGAAGDGVSGHGL